MSPPSSASLGSRLAASPVSWGADFPGAADLVSPRAVLEQIQEVGFTALELGPVGFFPEIGDELSVVGTWLVSPLHDPRARDAIRTQARGTCEAIRRAGGGLVVLIDEVRDERAATAGRSAAARRLSEGEWRALLSAIADVRAICGEFGLHVVFHPHAGTFVEFEDEIDRLIRDTDEGLGLCIDTGHCHYAGVDPVALIHRFSERVRHVHLKDVRAGALADARAAEHDFWTAVAEGIFCPLGDGALDFHRVCSALREIRYDGYATLEQDRDPSRSGSEAVDDVRRSFEFITATLRTTR